MRASPGCDSTTATRATSRCSTRRRSLFNAELSQAQTKGVLFQALVNLYKAMGGGWVVEADRMTAGPTNSER